MILSHNMLIVKPLFILILNLYYAIFKNLAENELRKLLRIVIFICMITFRIVATCHYYAFSLKHLWEEKIFVSLLENNTKNMCLIVVADSNTVKPLK